MTVLLTVVTVGSLIRPAGTATVGPAQRQCALPLISLFPSDPSGHESPDETAVDNECDRRGSEVPGNTGHVGYDMKARRKHKHARANRTRRVAITQHDQYTTHSSW